MRFRDASRVAVPVLALALAAAACGSGSRDGSGSGTGDIPRDVALRDWGSGSDCNTTTVPDMVKRVGSWVLVDADTAAGRLERGAAVFDADGVTFLGGTATPYGAAIDASMREIVNDLAGMQAELILAAVPSAERADVPYPQTAFVAVFPDGGVGWIGGCGYEWFTKPMNDYLAGLPGDPRAETMRIFAADEMALAALDEYLTQRDAEQAGESVAWEDLPPDRRNVDPEETPPDYLADLSHVEVFIQIPQGWSDWGVQVCALSSDGWHGCAAGHLGSASIPMVLRPGLPLELFLLDESGRFDRRMELLAVIEADILADAMESQGVVVATVTGSFAQLSDLRVAASESAAVFKAEVLSAESFRDTDIDEIGATETGQP